MQERKKTREMRGTEKYRRNKKSVRIFSDEEENRRRENKMEKNFRFRNSGITKDGSKTLSL